MENVTTPTTNSTDLYERFWWLAPKYFKELSLRPKYLVAVESSVMFIITITAFCGNSLVCFTLARNPRLRTSTNLLILVLAATDMLTACLPLTVATVVLIKGKWIVEVNPLDVKNFPCQFQGIIAPALTGFSLHIMALTAINRYICVVHQRLYNQLFSRKGTCLVILADGILILSLTLIPYPAGFANITFDPRRAMCFTTFLEPKSSQVITSTFFIIFVVVPMIVITFSYYRVFKKIRSSSFRNHAVNAKTSNSPQSTAATTTSKIQEVKITKTVFAVLLGYLTCWIPVIVCDQLSFNMINPRFPRQGELVTTYFFCLSSAINPFIYGTTSRALRKELWATIYHCKK